MNRRNSLFIGRIYSRRATALGGYDNETTSFVSMQQQYITQMVWHEKSRSHMQVKQAINK